MPAKFTDERKALYLFPRGYGSSGHRNWLYAIGLADGATKIGRTIRPLERILSHYRATVGGFKWVHVFAPTPRDLWSARRIERRALQLISEVSRPIRGLEVFEDLSRHDAIRLVRQAYAEAKAA